MAALFHYRAFDLVFASEIECPQMLVCNDQVPDVRICWGEVPRGTVPESGGSNELILRIPDAASFWIRNGTEIIVQKIQAFEPCTIQLFLLGSVITAILWQRGYFALHANAVASDSGALLFAGPSGIGKSTLAASFYNQGYRMISDDICAIHLPREGAPQVLSSYPYLKLWDDAVMTLDLTRQISTVVRQDLKKYYISCRSNFEPKPQPIKAIFIIDPDAPGGPIRLLNGAAAFHQIQRNAHRRQYLELLGLLGKSFYQATRIASIIPIYSVSRFQLMDPAAIFEAPGIL